MYTYITTYEISRKTWRTFAFELLSENLTQAHKPFLEGNDDADADILTVADKVTTLMVMLVLVSTTAHAEDINSSATLY